MTTDRDVVETYLTAWQQTDLAGVLGAYHRDLLLHWPGDHDLAGEHRGLDAALTALAHLQSRTGRTLHEVRDVTVDGADVIARVVEHWQVPDDPAPFPVERRLVFTVADGSIAVCTVIEHDQAAVDAFLAR